MPPPPTQSLAVLPINELTLETTPETPAVPLPQVTAPAMVAVAVFHNGLATTKLPLPVSAVTAPLPT